jgi:hypothetical protein
LIEKYLFHHRNIKKRFLFNGLTKKTHSRSQNNFIFVQKNLKTLFMKKALLTIAFVAAAIVNSNAQTATDSSATQDSGYDKWRLVAV